MASSSATSTTKATPKGATPAAAKDSAAPQAIPAAVEFEPPLACVRRILKTTLPASTNVGKDASAAFARSAGIFIIYLTACANDFARENRRQTITANDVMAAVKVSSYYL
jgi:histone H3/H4